MIDGYFRCIECKGIDHTGYVPAPLKPGAWLCSKCATGKWHECFVRPVSVPELINEEPSGDISLDS